MERSDMFNMERDVWKFALLMIVIGFIGIWYFDGYTQAKVENYYAGSHSNTSPHTPWEKAKDL
jgi:hypothetical protein